MKSKHNILIGVFLTVGTLSAMATNAPLEGASAKSVAPAITENSLSEDEVARLTDRVLAIRDIDKSSLTISEKREMKSELKEIKTTLAQNGGYVYISGVTILLIILIIVLL